MQERVISARYAWTWNQLATGIFPTIGFAEAGCPWLEGKPLFNRFVTTLW
jgi:hypothetical protein